MPKTGCASPPRTPIASRARIAARWTFALPVRGSALGRAAANSNAVVRGAKRSNLIRAKPAGYARSKLGHARQVATLIVAKASYVPRKVGVPIETKTALPAAMRIANRVSAVRRPVLVKRAVGCFVFPRVGALNAVTKFANL